MAPPLPQYDREALATLQQIHLPELLDNFSLTRDCEGDAATGAVASRTGTSASSEKEELLIWSMDIFRAHPFEADLANLLLASTDRASVYCTMCSQNECYPSSTACSNENAAEGNSRYVGGPGEPPHRVYWS
jgi:hypothetical protein